MKLIFESLNKDKIAINEVFGTILLTGVALVVADSILKRHNKKIESDTKSKQEKMLIGIGIIEKKPVDYSDNMNPNYKETVKELAFRNITSIPKAKEFAKKKCMTVKKFLENFSDRSNKKWTSKYEKFSKSGYILFTSGGGDNTVIDNGKLYYIDHETNDVTPTSIEEIIANNWKQFYDVLVERKIIKEE